MPNTHDSLQGTPITRGQRLRELWAFVWLAFIVMPLIAICLVAGWGFLVWFYQMFAGPPGPPMGGH